MKTIRRKACLFGAVTALSAVASALLSLYAALYDSGTWPFLFPGISAAALLLFLWIREYQKLRQARLIVENRILYIRPVAVAVDVHDGQSADPACCVEFFVSCFGLLLHTKIIKFNQNGVRLSGVEIGRDFVSLTYGKGERMHNTRLLRPELDSLELAEIAEKFEHETGVVPVITD